jgi:hypothetical protein
LKKGKRKMGGVCSRGLPVDKSLSQNTLDQNFLRDRDRIPSKSQVRSEKDSTFMHDDELSEKDEMASTNESMPPCGPDKLHTLRGSLQKSKSTRSKGTAKASFM